MPSADPAAVAELLLRASRSHGIVTTAVAAELGLTRAHLRTLRRGGHFDLISTGVLRAGAASATWRSEVAAAVARTGGVASHRCAARLHRLDGFANTPVEVTAPRNRTHETSGLIVHRATLDRSDVTSIESIQATSIARTLADLGAVVEDDAVEQALDDALRRGYSLAWIRQTLERCHRPGPSGTAALRRVLARPDRAGPLADSAFERILERLVVAAGLPKPVRQVEVRHRGRVVAVLDAAWQDEMVALEADSELWHFGPRRGRRARDRHNLLTSLGWEVLYAGWLDTREPRRLLDQLGRTLRGRAD